jgi:hypothetical protein
MEYRARQLYVGFVEGQTAKDGAKEVIAPVQSPGKVE